MNRIEKTLATVNLEGFGLEIGPSYNPIIPKSTNARIKTVDHLDRQGLLDKYRHLPTESLNAIEEVDYVWSKGSLLELIGYETKFDFIVASHFIEHTTDFLGFLQDCECLLKENGVLTLVVPDKRFCFDRLKSLTTIGSVISSHQTPRHYHSAGSILDHLAYSVSMNGDQLGWDATVRGQLQLQHPQIGYVRNLLDEGIFELSYIDIHRWIFTPTSFSLLVQDLHELGYIALVENNGFETTNFEFFISLSTDSTKFKYKDRLEMLLKIENEISFQGTAFKNS